MKRLLAMLCAAATLAAGGLAASVTVAAAGDDEQATAHSFLHQVSGSGIFARIGYRDTGSALFARGFAFGLDPSKHYITLVYDVASTASGPAKGQCIPSRGSGSPGFLNEAKMFVGEWLPMGSSVRHLRAVKTGASYTPIGSFKTNSIRQLIGPMNAPIRTITASRYIQMSRATPAPKLP